MRSILSTICLLFFLIQIAEAQMNESFSDRLFFGGNFGAGFSKDVVSLDISPIIGYRFTERFQAGPGLIYQYYKFFDLSTNNYGGKIFARYFLIPNAFAHTEIENLNLKFFEIDGAGKLTSTRRNVQSVFIGGGYRQMLGRIGGLDLLLLYNINENRFSPYQNPLIRIGFVSGF